MRPFTKRITPFRRDIVIVATKVDTKLNYSGMSTERKSMTVDNKYSISEFCL